MEAKRAGEALLKAKRQVLHGAFRKWVKDACPAVSYSQAKRYMLVAKKLVDKPFDEVADLSIEAFLGYEKKPAPAPSFTRDEAEYVLKINARAVRGEGGERDRKSWRQDF